MIELLGKYKTELEEELKAILQYWMNYAIDTENGGFYGKIDNDNKIYPKAPKGSVLNSRILWSFSASYNYTGENKYLQIAERAFDYITNHFVDKEYGGVYWTVDYKGNPFDTKKQIYALAFALYGISEFWIATGSEKAKDYALQLYYAIGHYSHDKEKFGYIEALTREWQEITDMRLSAKDANEKKSMNTHLHVLEAYANLYRIWPDAELKRNMQEIIDLFLNRIINSSTNHLQLFFDNDWQVRSNIVSYGHDIEASWLILEAAEITGDEELVNKVKNYSLKITNAAAEGLDKDGGLWYEYDAPSNYLVKEKHWWVQSEAVVGFFNAWQLTKNTDYFFKSFYNWQFIKNYILDREKGEWHWGIKDDYSIMKEEDKLGIWKCPYHNSRACLQIIKRIESINITSINEAISVAS